MIIFEASAFRRVGPFGAAISRDTLQLCTSEGPSRLTYVLLGKLLRRTGTLVSPTLDPYRGLRGAMVDFVPDYVLGHTEQPCTIGARRGVPPRAAEVGLQRIHYCDPAPSGISYAPMSTMNDTLRCPPNKSNVTFSVVLPSQSRSATSGGKADDCPLFLQGDVD